MKNHIKIEDRIYKCDDDNSVMINDVILLSKRVRNPVSKLQTLYNLLQEYRICQTKPLFECDLVFILDVMKRTVY